MPEETGSIGITEFINEVHGSPNEYASLLYLAAALQQRWGSARSTGPESAAHAQIVNLLKTRIAQLSHSSERKMRQAAVNASQISKALQKEGTSEDAARRFDPVLQLLQKQIEHSRQSVQVGMETVRKLDALVPAPETRRPGAERPGAEKRAAGAKKAASAKKAPAAKKAAKVASKGTSRKVAARKRGSQSKSASGESKPAAGE
jgi:hypothetical protein